MIQVVEEEIPKTLESKIEDGKEKQGEDMPIKKLWVDVISRNRIPANGMAINYSSPSMAEGEIEVVIELEDLILEIQFWDNILVMYVLGKNLSMNAVKQFMIRFWSFAQLSEVYYHDEGYFFLNLSSYKDKDLVMMRGPNSIHNMPMVLKEWCTDFNFKRDMIRTLPVWVTLPHLPLYLWSASSLGKNGSSIGKPLFSD